MYCVCIEYRKKSGSLEELEMLLEHELTGKCFHSFFKLSQTFMMPKTTPFHV